MTNLRRRLRLGVVGLALLAACSRGTDVVGSWEYLIPSADGTPAITVILHMKADGTWHEDYPATGGYGNGRWTEQDGRYELEAINSVTGETLVWPDGGTLSAYIERSSGGTLVYWYSDGSGGFPMERR